MDVSGVVFLITGSNSGIGYETAKAVAKQGGIVHLVCRNEERANQAKKAIEAETKNKVGIIFLVNISTTPAQSLSPEYTIDG